MTEKRVSVALITRSGDPAHGALAQGKILVQRRAAGSHLEGLWEFPGGKVEPDESWEEALVREVREELGVDSVAAGLFGERSFEYGEVRVRLRFYWTVLTNPAQEPAAQSPDVPLRWVTARELLELPVPDANKDLLPRIASVLEGQADEPSEARQPFGTLAWALVLLPVSFVAAAMMFLTLDNLVAAQHRDLGKIVESRFPLHVVGGNRAVFLGIFIVVEAAFVAWVHLRGARRRGA